MVIRLKAIDAKPTLKKERSALTLCISAAYKRLLFKALKRYWRAIGAILSIEGNLLYDYCPRHLTHIKRRLLNE